VGIDLGISSIVTLSDGTKLSYPKKLEVLYEKVRRKQKSVSRKVIGSSNHEKAKLVVAKLWLRIRRIRNDWAHKLTSGLVEKFSVIGIESLNIKRMIKMRSLARKIGEACWGEIVRQLTYKSELANSLLVRMDPWFPSSKLCSCCGHKMAELPLSIRTWVCPGCLTEHDRDINAAVNIEQVAQRSWETLNACGGDVSPMPVKAPATPLKQVSSF
jgi:putative transposase